MYVSPPPKSPSAATSLSKDDSLADDGEFTVCSTRQAHRNSIDSINEDFGISTLSPSNSMAHVYSTGSILSLSDDGHPDLASRRSSETDSAAATAKHAASVEREGKSGLAAVDQQQSLGEANIYKALSHSPSFEKNVFLKSPCGKLLMLQL